MGHRNRYPLTIPREHRKDKETIDRERNRRIFHQYLCGATREYLAAKEGLTVENIINLIDGHIRSVYIAFERWRRAEKRCGELAMELRLLKLGKEYPPDCPLEDLNCPELWLKWFHRAGITTMNQLRSVDAKVLLSIWHFPMGAIEWGILVLDRLGYSYVLKRPPFPELRGNGPDCRMCGRRLPKLK